jgi:monovalent cation:H+ antiporter-2, CPA2 family
METSFLLQAVIYLGAAVICVPLAKRLGLGSVLGYLIAGMLIGPFILGLVGEEGKDIMHFAEFGVVMMLFLIGLELEPSRLLKIRRLIFGMGGIQMALTVGVFFIIGLALSLPWQTALACGLALTMSSTAIVMQSLKEKGLSHSTAGQNSFAVLLFQDLMVVPILSLIPLLVLAPSTGPAVTGGSIRDLPGWLQTAAVLGAVGVVILVGRFAIVPLLRVIARTRLRELFTASALLIVVGIAYLMHLVGLSPALGTFLAGIILANSEFRHELESDLDPFKGLLLGLFFMGVGASINFHLIRDQPGIVALFTILIITIKTIVLLIVGKIYKTSWDQNILFALGLSQVGEFAFVLFAFIGQTGILTPEQTDLMMVITAISMTLTPLLFILNERLFQPKFGVKEKQTREPDFIGLRNKVIIAGFSHFGSTVGRFLRANGVEATILDNDSDQVDLLRKMGFRVYYGDATRVDLLESAGAAEARLLIVAIDSQETTARLAEITRKHFPGMELMVRTKDRNSAYDLIDLGIGNVYREHVDTSVRMGVDVLKKLGFRAYTATRAGQSFLRYDEQALPKLASQRHDQKGYISSVREEITMEEQMLMNDLNLNPSEGDHAWDSEHMREVVLKQ